MITIKYNTACVEIVNWLKLNIKFDDIWYDPHQILFLSGGRLIVFINIPEFSCTLVDNEVGTLFALKWS